MTKPAGEDDAQGAYAAKGPAPFAQNGRLPKRSIRFKVTLIAVLGALFAAAVVVGATAFAMQMILERTISNDLSDHLDKAQEAAEMGNFELAVQFAGSDIMQVIAEDGTVLASSANALGLAAIVDALDGDEESYELWDAKLKEAVDDRIESLEEAHERIDEALSLGNDNQKADGNAASTQASGSARAVDNDDDDDEDDGKEATARSSSRNASDSDDENDEDDEKRTSQANSHAQEDDDARPSTRASDDDDRVGSASGKTAAKQASSDDDDKSSANAGSNKGGTGTDSIDSTDDDDDGEGDDDEDDEDGEDSTRASSSKSRKTKASPRPLFLEPTTTYASEPDELALTDEAAPAPINPSEPSRHAGQPSQPGQPGKSTTSNPPASKGTLGRGHTTAQHDETYIDASSVFGNGGPYLVMQRKIESPKGQVTLAAMTSLASALLAAKTAAQLLVVVMAVLLVIVAFAAWRLTGRTLHPVEQMRASVQAIRESDLSMRIPVPASDRDLAPLAITFNDLLERIEAAVDRQKRFISDASHELKSPIAATSIMLETMREYPDVIDTRQIVDDLAGENQRMARIVGNMLVLARHDEGRSVVEPLPVDMYDMLMEEASVLGARSDVNIDTSGVRPVVCTTDREQLGHIVRNLLDNAARYAQSTVKLTCEPLDDAVRIMVEDDGPGIPEADRERVFERFIRLEDETHRKKDSTGLGLSVVKSTAERLGGTVRFTDSSLGGACAIVDLPA